MPISTEYNSKVVSRMNKRFLMKYQITEKPKELTMVSEKSDDYNDSYNYLSMISMKPIGRKE
jgi:hypothetical protein